MEKMKRRSLKPLSLVALLLALQSPAASQPTAEDVARISSVIQAIGVFVDLGDFGSICQLYDELSVADYSSLWGNEPSEGTPSNRATAWSGFIPGFDTTRHDIRVDHVSVQGAIAAAVARVQADHWLDGKTWSVTGTYDVVLRKRGQRWLISAWTFTLEEESGNRALVDEAEIRAADAIERPVRCRD